RKGEESPWFDLLQDDGVGISGLALTDGDRCPIISLIRRARAAKPSFSVLDIGAVGNPWSVHSGVADVIFDYQATNYPPCFSTAEISTRGKTCCSSKDDDCFDELYTRERCCRGADPVFLGMIDGDVTDETGTGWERLQRLVDMTSKFDLAITSHLLEDVTNPSVLAKLLPRVAKAGIVAVPSKFYELARLAPIPHEG
ncbi:unnamed protein product, partial [Effrenium voratum]